MVESFVSADVTESMEILFVRSITRLDPFICHIPTITNVYVFPSHSLKLFTTGMECECL